MNETTEKQKQKEEQKMKTKKNKTAAAVETLATMDPVEAGTARAIAAFTERDEAQARQDNHQAAEPIRVKSPASLVYDVSIIAKNAAAKDTDTQAKALSIIDGIAAGFFKRADRGNAGRTFYALANTTNRAAELGKSSHPEALRRIHAITGAYFAQ